MEAPRSIGTAFVSPQKIAAQQEGQKLKPFNNSKAALAQGLGLNDIADLDRWLKSDLWKPYFDEFAATWLDPYIAKCMNDKIAVSKGPDFTKIQEHLAYEESLAARKLTRARVNKSDWEEIDHYAYLIYHTVLENEQHYDGVLRGRQMTPDQRQWAMYQAMVYSKRPFSNSKQIRRLKTEAKAKNSPRRATRVKGDEPVVASSSRGSKSIDLLSLEANLPSVIVHIREQAGQTSGLEQPVTQDPPVHAHTKHTRNSSASKRPLATSTLMDFPINQSVLEAQQLSPKRLKSGTSRSGGTVHQPATDTAISDHVSDTVNNNIPKPELPPGITESVPENLTQTQPLDKGKGRADESSDTSSEPGDFEYDQFLNTNAAIITEMKNSNWDLTQRGWQLAALDLILADYQSELHYNRVLRAAGGHDIRLMDAATEAWRREIEHHIDNAQTWIDAPEVKNEDLVQAREDDKRSQTLETERISSEAARDALNCHGEKPRLPGMPRSIWLRFWQIPAIHALMEFQQMYTGCLLADKMGLGKTITFVGHILQNIHERKLRVNNGEQIPAKPKLILVPAALVGQTVAKIITYAPGLRVLRYHEDERRKSTGYITGLLTRDHTIFDTDREINANTVLVSSHATFAGRHGPGACKKWREEHGMSAATADALINIFDPNCPSTLHHKFDIIWVDEADALKRADSRLNTCMQWTAPDFIGLSTATPNRNSIQDTDGYLRLIKPRKPFPPEQVRQLIEAEPDFNPYQVPKNDPRAILRIHPTYAKRFIFDICDEDPIKSGAYIAKLNELIMIRRTHASSVDNCVIGESIPPLIRRRLEVDFSFDAQTWYERISETPLRSLVTTDEKGRLIWNAACFRKLVLFALWPGFEHIEQNVYADTIKKWRRANNLLHTWLQMVHAKLSPDDPSAFQLPEVGDWLTQIRILCQASPKIRVVLSMMEEVIRYRKKKAIWVLLPAEQLLIWDVLNKIGIDAQMFSSDLTQDERDKLVNDWNNSSGAPFVLILVFSMNSQGLDLQTHCNETINVDIPMSRAILESADHRFRRVGQPKDYVISWNIHIRNTVMDRQIQNNLRKALGNVMSELNSSIFRGQAGDMGQAGPDVPLDIGRWVIVNDKLVPYDHPLAVRARQQGVETQELENLEVILQILQEERGQWAEIVSNAAPATDTFVDD